MEVKKIEVMSFLDTLTIQEKKHGYSRILFEFLMDLWRGMICEDESKEYAELLINLPYFLKEDLVDFDDERFWDEIFENAPSSDKIFDWFLLSIPIGTSFSRYKFIKEIQERWNIKEAE